MDFYQLLNSTEYDFLRTEPRLKNLILLGLGGSSRDHSKFALGSNWFDGI